MVNNRSRDNKGPPKALPGFDHVLRYWDPVHETFTAKILPGEYYVTNQNEAVVTVLGSCISACIRDPSIRVGGINHFMLPDNRNRDGKWSHDGIGAATRYGTFAMEHVINKILEHGGRRENLEVKVVGGGQILRGVSDIGKQNIAFIRQYLQAEELPIVNEDLGDIYPRKVRYYPATGRLQVKRLKSLSNDTIFERERSYKNELEHKPPTGEIDVFNT